MKVSEWFNPLIPGEPRRPDLVMYFRISSDGRQRLIRYKMSCWHPSKPGWRGLELPIGSTPGQCVELVGQHRQQQLEGGQNAEKRMEDQKVFTM